MESILHSFVLVFVSEMGDKTQLLALILAAQFKRPIPILLGILAATLLNHGLASYLGVYLTGWISPLVLKWILAGTFIGFGVWILVPDKEEDSWKKQSPRWGPFMTTLVAFFLAEMGDKTQLATVALGAKYAAPVAVTIGTTLGMMGADGLAVFLGHKLQEKIPMKWVHRIASLLFILFGLLILFS